MDPAPLHPMELDPALAHLPFVLFALPDPAPELVSVVLAIAHA